MTEKINFQYLFSYFGIIPYIILIIDKFFLIKIEDTIIINFSIYYSLLIIVFIGAINWNLVTKVKSIIVFHGILPSVFATIIILVNLYNLNYAYIFFSLKIFLLYQLLMDYIYIYSKINNKTPFFFLRLPLTLIIITFLLLIYFAIY